MTPESWNWGPDDVWIIIVGILGSVSAALLGNFLVLRRMSLLGDAISHAVLPGLAVAFFITGTRSSWPMFLGAVVTGVLTAWLTHWIQRHGRIDEGASMGVVFTTLFSIGLVLIFQFAYRVDLDARCVLYGAIELTPLDTISILGFKIPRVVPVLATVLTINFVFIVVFYKELKLSSFDPALATTIGFNAAVLHYALMTLVAVTTVACFDSVGNILVVAMLIVPASTAILLSSRLHWVIVLSALIAALAAMTGHLGAVIVPRWFGFRSTSTAGMMAVASGLLFFLASLFAPSKGVVVRWYLQRRLAMQILAEDIVAALYRFEEKGQCDVRLATLAELLIEKPRRIRWACWWQKQRGLIQSVDGALQLTELGERAARELVQTHRLWEFYLVDQAGTAVDRIHMQAEKLEHFTDQSLREQLQEAGRSTTTDPHGRKIPRD